MKKPDNLNDEQDEEIQNLVWIQKYFSERSELNQQEVLTHILPKLNRAIECSDQSIMGGHVQLLELRAKIYSMLGMQEEAKQDQERSQGHIEKTINHRLSEYIKAMEAPSTMNISNSIPPDVTTCAPYRSSRR